MAANIILTGFMGTGKSTVGRLLAAWSDLEIATGGRLMLDTTNAAALARNGRVFCLTATPAEILARVGGSGGRPLLNVPDPLARIEQLLTERAAGYGRYPQIDTTSKTVDEIEITEEIIRWYSTME